MHVVLGKTIYGYKISDLLKIDTQTDFNAPNFVFLRLVGEKIVQKFIRYFPESINVKISKEINKCLLTFPNLHSIPRAFSVLKKFVANQKCFAFHYDDPPKIFQMRPLIPNFPVTETAGSSFGYIST